MFSDEELLVCRCQVRRKALTSREEDAGHEVLGGGSGEGAGEGT